MPIGTKVIKKTISYGDKNEYAYYTEDMLEDSLAIKETQIYTDEGRIRTLLSVRCDAGHHTEEYFLYIGSYLAPIQVYRMAKDITDLYDFYLLEDFLEIVGDYLSCDRNSTEGSLNPMTAKIIDDDIKEFFQKIQQD